jgi:hypothetical protein
MTTPEEYAKIKEGNRQDAILALFDNTWVQIVKDAIRS